VYYIPRIPKYIVYYHLSYVTKIKQEKPVKEMKTCVKEKFIKRHGIYYFNK